jgi:hypothetical protein
MRGLRGLLEGWRKWREGNEVGNEERFCLL